MMSAVTQILPVFEKFRVRPVINACGIYTDLGGSVFSPGVRQAMHEVNRSFVRMVDLLDRAGEMLASLLSAEAARVVPGASAAITLGTVSYTHLDVYKRQLPDRRRRSASIASSSSFGGRIAS